MSVHALKEKWFELSAPKPVDIIHGSCSKYIDPEVKNLKEKVTALSDIIIVIDDCTPRGIRRVQL